MKKKVFFILLNSIVTLFLIFSVYNLLPESIQDFHFPILTSFIFFQTFFSLKNLKLTVVQSFLSILLINLLIDASTMITGDELIPLRFPFASIFPIFGFYMGVLTFKKRLIVIPIFLLFLIFTYFSYTKFIPDIILKMESKSKVLFNNQFLSSTFLTPDSLVYSISKNNKKKIILLDFYYVGCSACEQKFIFLDSLLTTTKEKLDIYCICNGQISSFQKFKQNFSNRKSRLTFLYDQNHSISQYFKGLNFYPFEFIVNMEGKEIATQVGFTKEAIPSYQKKYNHIITNTP